MCCGHSNYNEKSETFREETRKMVRAEVYEVKDWEIRECNLVIKGIEQIGKVDLGNDPLGIGHMQWRTGGGVSFQKYIGSGRCGDKQNWKNYGNTEWR